MEFFALGSMRIASTAGQQSFTNFFFRSITERGLNQRIFTPGFRGELCFFVHVLRNAVAKG